MRNASQSISLMNNLNELEVAYFTGFNANGTKVQAYLNTKESVKLLKKKGFDSSVKMWHQVNDLWSHFTSDEQKAQRVESGIVMTSTDFTTKVLGYADKSEKNRMCRIAERINQHAGLLTAYKRERTRQENAGESVKRSAQDFDKWSKVVCEQIDKGADVDGAAEATGEAESQTAKKAFQVQTFGVSKMRATIDENGVGDLNGASKADVLATLDAARAIFEAMAD